MKEKLQYNYDRNIIPNQMNPILSKEEKEEVNFFLKWGYLVIDNALNDDQIKSLREAFNYTFENLTKLDHIEIGLFEYDERFLFLLDNNPVIQKVKAILGNCIQLHSATAINNKPGSPSQHWHRDGPWPVDPKGTPFGSIPGQINCGYYLDELTIENGPIAIVPGSQKFLSAPPKKKYSEFPDQKLILTKPGQVVLFNGWIYHRGLRNCSKKNRRVCLICYQNAWIKSRETFDGPRMKLLRENGTNEQKLLLGKVDYW